MFEDNVELFSYFRQMICISLRLEWKPTLMAFAKDYIPSSGGGDCTFPYLNYPMTVTNNSPQNLNLRS